MVLAPVGDKQVGEAVIIEITGTDPLAPSGGLKPRILGDIAEPAVPFVMIEPVCPAVSGDQEKIG